MNNIKFIKLDTNVNDDNTIIVNIGLIDSEEVLFKVLAEKLNFPDYFEHNWNALNDCLSDLSWIQNKNILINHIGELVLPDEKLKYYFEIAKDSSKNLENYNIKLTYIFPEIMQSKFNDLIKN